MAHRTRLVMFTLLMVVAPTFAQRETREPPLADDVLPAKAVTASDAPSVVRPAQHLESVGPGSLPPAITGPVVLPGGGSMVIPAAYPATPVGELPTPLVTLNVEGVDVSTSGQPVVYKLHVRNVSSAKAHNVVLKVIPPKNAELIKREPVPTHDEAEARWDIKVLEPGQSRTIELAYKPKADADEIKIQARVQFDFGRGMVTSVAPPAVSVKKEGPDKVVVNDVTTYRIVVKNTGRVIVRDIEVRDQLVQGLVHEDRELSRGMVDGRLTSSVDPNGRERMWSISALAPGESRTLEYRVRAKQTGRLGSTVLVKAPGLQDKIIAFDEDVQTAALKLEVTGPPDGRGTVSQAAPYKIVVRNQGTADLKNVVVRCLFPTDMRPTKATNEGRPFRDSVQWIFKELKANEAKELTLGLSTSSPGVRTVQFVAKADRGDEQRQVLKTDFAGVPNIDWDTEAPGTASVGKVMTYKVYVSNRGSSLGQVELTVDLPPNVDVVGSNPPGAPVAARSGPALRFPKVDVPAGKKVSFTIEVKPRSAGEARAIFWLKGDAIGQEPVRHDKITNVSGTNERNPTPPPPAGTDRSRVGFPPGG